MIRTKETTSTYKELNENAIFWQILGDLDDLQDLWRKKKLNRKELIKIAKTLNNLLYDLKA